MMQAATLDGIAKSPHLRRRVSNAEKVAAHMAAGKYARAISEAELTGNPAGAIAMAVLVLAHQYGIEAQERAVKGLAVHT